MTLYVLTLSDHYYPAAGAGDWLGVFTDEATARRAYDEACDRAGRNSSVHGGC
jgi:hypothetical protein